MYNMHDGAMNQQMAATHGAAANMLYEEDSGKVFLRQFITVVKRM